MKKKYLSLCFWAMMLQLSMEADAVSVADTSFYYNGKQVEIKDKDTKGRMSIRVSSPGSEDEPAIIYEGRIAGRNEVGDFLPIPDIIVQEMRFNRRMRAHFAGVSLGYSNVSTASLGIGSVSGFSLDPQRSSEVIFNMLETIIPLNRTNTLGLTTGLGLNWRTYFMDHNYTMAMGNDALIFAPGAAGRDYAYQRFKTVHLTIPLILEWQPILRRDLYFGVGAIAGIKTYTSYKEHYTENGTSLTHFDNDSKYYTNPLTVDFILQAGYGLLGLYAKYSPISIFRSEKGPDAHAVSMGFHINF